MSATALKHRWTSEVQTALMRRRAKMTRTVLPSPLAREQLLLSGLIDRTTSHWARAPPRDEGDDENDTGTELSARR